MDIEVKGRNLSVTEALENYALEKVARLSKFYDDEKTDSRAEVELIHERNPSHSQPEVVETTLFINGTVLKAREGGEDMYASIDRMSDKLERQVRRFRGRQLDRWQGQREKVEASEPGAPKGDEAEVEGRIVRTKQFQMKPMSAEEAALQMDLLDHAFFVFTSADTGDINVVYRRRDSNYGLIEPAR